MSVPCEREYEVKIKTKQTAGNSSGDEVAVLADFAVVVKDRRPGRSSSCSNIFAPMATRAVRSFRDEYLLELVNLDNVDAVRDQDVDERMLPKALVADVEKMIQSLGGDEKRKGQTMKNEREPPRGVFIDGKLQRRHGRR